MRKWVLLCAALTLATNARTSTTIYDTLERQYTYGHGNCDGGQDVFGTRYDFRIFDDISLTQTTTITEMTVSNATFGIANATHAKFRLYYYKQNGEIGDEITGPNGDTVSINETSFDDLRFPGFPIDNLVRKEIAAVGLNYVLLPGRYWIGLEVISRDWHYTLDGNYGMGMNSWSYEYDGSWETGPYFIGTDVNMRIEGNVVPEFETFWPLALLLGTLISCTRRRVS